MSREPSAPVRPVRYRLAAAVFAGLAFVSPSAALNPASGAVAPRPASHAALLAKRHAGPLSKTALFTVRAVCRPSRLRDGTRLRWGMALYTVPRVKPTFWVPRYGRAESHAWHPFYAPVRWRYLRVFAGCRWARWFGTRREHVRVLAWKAVG